MEGPTSSCGSRNGITCLTLQEHDDYDDDDDDDTCQSMSARQHSPRVFQIFHLRINFQPVEITNLT